jgi:hypothetical protein
MFWSSFIVFSHIAVQGMLFTPKMIFVGTNAAAKSHINFVSFLLNKSNLRARRSSGSGRALSAGTGAMFRAGPSQRQNAQINPVAPLAVANIQRQGNANGGHSEEK